MPLINLGEKKQILFCYESKSKYTIVIQVLLYKNVNNHLSFGYWNIHQWMVRLTGWGKLDPSCCVFWSAFGACRPEVWSKNVFRNVSSFCIFLTFTLFSMSAKDLSYLLVGETSQGRSSDEQKVGSDPPNSYQQVLT